MTPDLIAQAEAALDGVTPGEWKASFSKWEPNNFIVQTDHPCRRVLAQFDGDGDGPDDQSLADARFIAWCRAGVPALIARIRELEGERERARHDAGVFVQSGLDWKARAEAAEAKLAEVEKANRELSLEILAADEAREEAINRRDAAEATVATLTAQVEAMRVSAMKAMTIANGALDPTATEKTFRRDLVQIREELRGALWPAALTTENQNG